MAGSFARFGDARRSDGASLSLSRIISILLTLLQDGTLDCGACAGRFSISVRELQRYLKKLREIGEEHGFTITYSKGGRVFLHARPNYSARLSRRRAEDLATLGRIASALRGPTEHAMREAIAELPGDDTRGFLHLREATPAMSDHVTRVFTTLEDAAAGPALVEFTYTARGTKSLRRVEPYRVIARTGRYYLVAYDLQRSAWRRFALDAISGAIRNVGSFKPRPIPDEFLAYRAVGWMSGNRRAGTAQPVEVTIALEPVVAAAVTARDWQEGQHVATLPDGRAEITLGFYDLAEAVRWVLSFAPDATIISPPEAAALLAQTAHDVMRRHGDASATARQEQELVG